MTSNSIFVYGSLMSNQPAHRIWPHPSENFTAGLVQADLYDLGPYPAIIPGSGYVLGELHWVQQQHWQLTISALDEFEEYDPNLPSTSLYKRNLVEVQTADGPEEAWVYFLQSQDLISRLDRDYFALQNNTAFLNVPCVSWAQHHGQNN